MLRNYMGIINLEESEKDIRNLTGHRPIGTIPLAGRYRLIDFMLSNMVNAGLRHISVFSKKETRSLTDHLGTGRAWDIARKNDGLFIFQHSLLGRRGSSDESQVAYNMDFIRKTRFDYVILSSSYMILNIDLEKIARTFEEKGADILAVYKKVSDADQNFLNCTLLQVDSNDNIVSCVKNIGIEKEALVCSEIFIMKKEILLRLMYDAVMKGVKKPVCEVICENINTYNVMGYKFDGYMSCVNSIKSYYMANMDMLNSSVKSELFNKKHPIYTRTNDSPPALYNEESSVKNSVIADGSIIRGKVENSIISRGVEIGKNAELKGCIILQGAKIKEGVSLTNVIVEKNKTVDENVVIKCPVQYPLVLERQII